MQSSHHSSLGGNEVEDFIDAAKNGNVNLLRTYLKDNVCHVDCQNNDGDTALIWASVKGYKDVFDLLLEHNCDLNMYNNFGTNAFLQACRHNRIEIMQCLLDLGVDVNVVSTNSEATALYQACSETGHTEVVRVLCNHHCKISPDAFFYACSQGFAEIINLLLAAGFNPLSDGRQGGNYTVLACMKGYLKIVEALIAHNCDINATNQGCDGETCLVMACRGNFVDIVRLLLDHNCDVNARNESGMLGFTGLLHACRNGNVEIVKLLLEKDCALDVLSNNGGSTCLMYAVSHRNIEIINILIEKGCDINAKDKHGATALMQACAATISKPGIVEVVNTLLLNNCDIHIQNNHGLTALMIAFSNCDRYFIDPITNQMSYEYMTVSKLLLNAGSDYMKVCDDGKAALDMIKESGLRNEIQQFISFPLELKEYFLRLPRLRHSVYHNKHTLTKTIGGRMWGANCDICKQSGSVYCCVDCNIDVCVGCIHKEESETNATVSSTVTETFSSEVIEENKEDICDIKDLFVRIGFSKKASNKYAEILVIKCDIGSETLFRRKLSGNMAHYVSILNISDDEQEILRDYLNSAPNSTSSSPVATIKNSPTPSSGGYASSPLLSPMSPSSPSSKIIDWNDLEYLEVIGKGAYSVVLKAKYLRYIVAVKILTVTSSEALHKLASDELMTINNAESKVRNRDIIIQAIGICQGVLPSILSSKFSINIAQGYGIVLRYEGGGSVESLLYPSPTRPKKLIPLKEKIRILMQIASGLDELHSVGILHGDIKPGNVLLSDHTPPLVRLADFGHAEIKEQALNKDSTLRETVHRKGTPVYTAPECLPSLFSSTVSKITRRTDIYSFAILAWEVFNKNGQRAFANITNELALVHTVTVSDSRPDLDDLMDDVPPAVRDMIQCCWDKDRTKRLSALQCYNTLELAYNILSQAKFDIFFSHPWRNKNVLRYAKKYLNSHGYRVWYDENDIGWDLSRSMKDGIQNSQIILVCLNKAYESSKNCMFELIESCKINKNIVTLVTEPEPFAWAGGNTTHGNAKDMCDLLTKKFIDIGELCAKPGWPAENDPDDTPVSDELLDELREKVAQLIRLIQDGPLFCMPSL